MADEASRKEALRYVLMASATSALTAMTLGIDVGVMGQAAEDVQDYFGLSDLELELVIGSLNFVSAFGALLGGPAADRFGRRPSVTICVILYLVGTLLMALSPTWTTLLAGRIVTGVGVGVAFVTVPVYVAELAPARLRGRLTTLFDISINVGILVGYIIGYVVDVSVSGAGGSDEIKWRLDLGLGAVPPAVVLFLMGILPESPRFLLMKERRSEAVEVLTKTLGSADAAQLEAAAIARGLESENDAAAGDGAASWSDVLFPKTRLMKRAMFIVLGLAFAQQVTGSEAVLYYAGDFLEDAGLSSRELLLLGNIAVGVSKLAPELLSLLYVDSFGRTMPLIGSSALMTVFIGLLGVAYAASWPGSAVVGLLCCVMFAFSIAIGPFTWIVVAEVLPQRCRAKGTMLGIFVNRITSGTVALTALSTAKAFTFAGFFFFYAAVSAVSVIFYATCVPETAGRALTEIELMLAGDAPVRGSICARDPADKGKCYRGFEPLEPLKQQHRMESV